MARLKFMSPPLLPVILLIILVVPGVLASVGVPATPNYPGSPYYSSSPSYPAAPATFPSIEVPGSVGVPATPNYPASPNYPGLPYSPPNYPVASPPCPSVGVPAPSKYPAVPSSDIPWPEVPTSLEAPVPYSYPPISELVPNSSPSEPISPTPSSQSHRSRGIKAAYWPSFDEFPASSIETSYFTHIYYAFLLPEPNTFKLNITALDQTKMPELINTIRSKNSQIKILLSIGGASNDPNVFSKMASTRQTRSTFINSTIETARKYGFDGVDFDWEFPATQLDMSNLGFLYRHWRKSLQHEAKVTGNKRLLLTSAVYFSSKFTTYGEPRAYPIESITKYVDWVSPMCFDYHGKWENFTGVHSALVDPNSDFSTMHGIGSWIKAGVPSKKLVMGLPLYGHTWTLRDPNVNGVGAPAIGIGPGDEFGFLNYDKIVEFNTVNNAVVKFDYRRVGYYSYAGDSWVGYDDVRSVNIKVRIAKLKGLGGYFFWALGQDKDWTLSRQASIAWGH